MKRCVIIDDEPLAIQLLNSYVEKIDDLELAGSFTNPLEALGFLQKETVDIVFLDVQMPELSGIQVAKIIGYNTSIIFTTAYPNYAVEGFELNATDYLMKPITLERFLQAVNRLESKSDNASVDALSNSKSKDYIFVKTEYRHQKIKLSEILYFKGFGDYVSIHLDKERILTLENMKSFEQSLPNDLFMRVHKSYIVSLEHIDYIEKNRIVIRDESIAIGGKYQDAFWQKIKK